MTTPPPSTRSPRYHLRLIPRGDRFPKRAWHWYRPALAVILAAGLVRGVPWAAPRMACRPGPLPSAGVWSQGGECVGATTGPYAFGEAGFGTVMRTIAAQNRRARTGSCAGNVEPVTVGALVTLTSPDAGGRAVHELEGLAAAQARANGEKASCIHPIRLKVAQMGAAEQAATAVAELLSHDVVAVVGMGLSHQKTADAADVLARHHVPMVGSVITAEGFDRNGSAQDRPDFRGCDPRATYKDGIGRGFFYRVAYRNGVQIDRLAAYLAAVRQSRLNFILTPITLDDPYPCTMLPLLHRRFGDVLEVRFDPEDPTTVAQSAKRICASEGAVDVFYAARARDLARFLKTISDQSADGQCRFSTITVVSGSDAERIRAREIDPNLEVQRREILDSTSFRNGTIRLVYTPLADPDVLAGTRGPGFDLMRRTFTGLGFDAADLGDGWAINGYDALSTVAAALNTLSAGQKVTPTQVNTAIGAFSPGGGAIPGAGGAITFDNDGNRADAGPVVVRLCPPVVRGQIPTTVRLYPPGRHLPLTTTVVPAGRSSPRCVGRFA